MSSSGSALPAIGAHCSLPSCNLNDFLPIRCKCEQLFCRDHIAPDIHLCPLQHIQRSTDGPPLKLQRCAAQACNKPSLESFIVNPTDTVSRSPAVCLGCTQAFCAEHREPRSHACTSAANLALASEPLSDKNAAAKALLAKHFGSSSANAAGRSLSSKPNPKKEAQQRQLAVMKMRHKAQPGNPKDTAASVPMDQRLHLKVSQAGISTSERIFWFPKTVVTGRALDMLAAHFKMTISDSQPLKLLLSEGTEDSVALRTDQPLADQVPDGAALLLSR